MFVNHITGVNTQSVESFKNGIKHEIKKQKKVITKLGQIFLNEFCFWFNYKNRKLEAMINLLSN